MGDLSVKRMLLNAIATVRRKSQITFLTTMQSPTAKLNSFSVSAMKRCVACKM
jgi:hypothetical protein